MLFATPIGASEFKCLLNQRRFILATTRPVHIDFGNPLDLENLALREIVDIQAKGLARELNKIPAGESLPLDSQISLTGPPVHTAIHAIVTGGNDQLQKIIMSTEVDLYSSLTDHFTRAQFLAQLVATPQGNLKRSQHKVRYRLFDKRSATWSEQKGGPPLDIHTKVILPERNGHFFPEIMGDFSPENSQKMAEDFKKIYITSEDILPLRAQGASLANISILGVKQNAFGQISSLTMGLLSELQVLTPTKNLVGRVLFTRVLKVLDDGTLAGTALPKTHWTDVQEIF